MDLTDEDFLNATYPREDLSPAGDENYILRWVINKCALTGEAVYVHKIIGSDWAREPHDHPKPFVSIGLKGSYVEEVYTASYEYGLQQETSMVWEAPWYRSFPANHIHRLVVPEGQDPAWTLCLTGQVAVDRAEEWGFYSPDGSRTLFRDYMRENWGWE